MIGAEVPGPWEATRIDPDVALAEVRRLFPGVTAWAGEYTGSYWVLLDDALHEFKDPHALIAWLHARLTRLPRPSSGPPRQMRSAAAATTPTRDVARGRRLSHGRHSAGSTRPSRPMAASDHPAVLFDVPPGRWRRLLEGVRRFFLGEEDMAW